MNLFWQIVFLIHGTKQTVFFLSRNNITFTFGGQFQLKVHNSHVRNENK